MALTSMTIGTLSGTTATHTPINTIKLGGVGSSAGSSSSSSSTTMEDPIEVVSAPVSTLTNPVALEPSSSSLQPPSSSTPVQIASTPAIITATKRTQLDGWTIAFVAIAFMAVVILVAGE